MKKILYFSATWCGPCIMMSKTIEELSNVYTIEKIDVDKDSKITKDYGIKSIPTFILIEDRVEVSRIVGAQSKSSLEKFFG